MPATTCGGWPSAIERRSSCRRPPDDPSRDGEGGGDGQDSWKRSTLRLGGNGPDRQRAGRGAPAKPLATARSAHLVVRSHFHDGREASRPSWEERRRCVGDSVGDKTSVLHRAWPTPSLCPPVCTVHRTDAAAKGCVRSPRSAAGQPQSPIISDSTDTRTPHRSASRSPH